MISTDSNSRFEALRAQHAPKIPGSAVFRSVDSALKAVLRCETDQERKEHAEIITIRYLRTNDPGVCNELKPESLQMFNEMREWIKYFKHGFFQITNEIRNYQKFENSNIIDLIISIQDQLDSHNIVQSYQKALLSVKDQFSWPEEFVSEWVQKTIYMKENKLELFKKREEPKEYNQTIKTGKRSSPVMDSKAEVETQVGEEPAKKLKKDSINYRALVIVIERVLEFTHGQKKQALMHYFEAFKKSESLQPLKLVEQETARKIFEMRSFIKLFLDGITEAMNRTEYRHLADAQVLERILGYQKMINPNNVFESYKDFLQANHSNMGWPVEMVEMILNKVVELKRAEVEFLMRK